MNRESDPSKLSFPFGGREFAVSGQEFWQWRQQARQQAIAAEIPPNELDWLLQELTGLDRLTLRLETFRDRATVPLKLPFTDLQALWQHRVQERIPVQYLAQVAPWREFLLRVSPAVLIPRPETECLIELAVMAVGTDERMGKWGDKGDIPNSSLSSPSHWADLGTGSGAIALGLATAFPHATIHAVDYSAEALAIAQENAATYDLTKQIQFYQGSWLAPLENLRGKLSGIVSNPPYIPSQMVLQLQPEVAQHEPHLALDGGIDGLDAVRHLVQTAPEYLCPGGVWLVELMEGQAISVAELLQNQGSYHSIQIHPDLAGIDRFVLAHTRETCSV